MDEVLIDFGDASTQVFHVGAGVGRRSRARRGARRGARAPRAALVGGAVRARARARAHRGGDVRPAAVPARDPRPDSRAYRGGQGIYGSHTRAETAAMVPGLELLRDHGAAAVAELCRATLPTSRAYRVVERAPIEATFGGCGSSRARRRRREAPSSPAGSRRSRPATARRPDTLAVTLVEALLAGYGGTSRLAPLDGHDPRLGDRRRRQRRRALLDARVRLGRLRRGLPAQQHARGARRDRHRGAPSRGSAAEHDDADARARRRCAASRRRQRRVGAARRARSFRRSTTSSPAGAR